LQHRSGRTGRAGKKGTAIILVPYPRRRRIEALLRQARVQADWIDAPTREDIRARDQERLLEALLAPVEFDDLDRALAERLLAARSPQDVAAMLVRAHRAAMPEPEELIEHTPEARANPQDRHRPGFDDTVWFRLNIGRKQNADPRWILPLLCRRGHVTRGEIGAIRILPGETHFQVPRAIAARFAAALVRTADGDDEDGAVRIEPSDGPPRPPPRQKPPQGGWAVEDAPAQSAERGYPGPKLHRKNKPKGADEKRPPSGPPAAKPWKKRPKGAKGPPRG
jgi:ATP-dependent RNA helicase DeaD